MDADPPELNATHPLLSLIAAVFWVLCEWSNIEEQLFLTLDLCSVAPVMGQVAHCVRNHLRTTLYLRSRVVLLYFHGEASPVSLEL